MNTVKTIYLWYSISYMKSLSLAKPLILVVVGHPGAGKTFFSQQFSDTFSAPRVDYDYVAHSLAPLSSNGKKETHRGVMAIIDNQISELLKTQKTFIIDGLGATKVERITLKKRAQDAGYEMLLVWVQTDEATAKYRAVSRKQDDRQPLSAEEYSTLVKKFNAPQANEAQVVISGKHTYATQAKAVLKKLVVPREDEVRNQSIVNHDGRTPTAGTQSSGHGRGIIVR